MKIVGLSSNAILDDEEPLTARKRSAVFNGHKMSKLYVDVGISRMVNKMSEVVYNHGKG